MSQDIIGGNEVTTCVKCGKPMKFNVPRMGPAGGFVHSDTGHLLCAGEEPAMQSCLATKSKDGICPQCGRFHEWLKL